MERIASGPKRAPTRKVAPVSNGAPSTAKSTSAVVCTNGRRMKVRTPVKRGDSSELAGKKRGITELSRKVSVNISNNHQEVNQPGRIDAATSQNYTMGKSRHE